MAEHRTAHNTERQSSQDDWEDPGYSALPAEGTKCVCGDDAHAAIIVQTGIKKCDACGSEQVQSETVHLCDLHNDLRMQGKLDNAKLLLAHKLHVSGGLRSMAADERDATLKLVLGLADPESAVRVWASDQSGVRLFERTEAERATRDLQHKLRQEAGN